MLTRFISTDQAKHIKEDLVLLLDNMFSHMSFWVLSRRWKLKAINQFADVLLIDYDIAVTHFLKNNNLMDVYTALKDIPEEYRADLITQFVEQLRKVDY